MNGRVAKALRKAVYGDGSKRDKGALNYAFDGFRYGEKTKRRRYQVLKKKWYREKARRNQGSL